MYACMRICTYMWQTFAATQDIPEFGSPGGVMGPRTWLDVSSARTACVRSGGVVSGTRR